MSALLNLPTRRDEAWRWSDLRAAVSAVGANADASVGEGHVVERLHQSGATQPPTLVVATGSQETITEDLEWSSGFSWVGGTLVLEPGADVTRIIRQRGGANGVGVAFNRVIVGAGARFSQFILAEGAKLARIETHVAIEGEGAEITLNGAYLADAGMHADLTSVIHHKTARASTRQLIKGVARTGGRGVFQGKIVVDQSAQFTDARQYHHGMLLEAGAEIFAKPELMIFADDVQCAHGNTAGGIDAAALFYMRSRGIPEALARAMLIESFLTETIPETVSGSLQEQLVERIRGWLGGVQ